MTHTYRYNLISAAYTIILHTFYSETPFILFSLTGLSSCTFLSYFIIHGLLLDKIHYVCVCVIASSQN